MEPIKEDGGLGMSLPHPMCILPLVNYFYIEHWSYIIEGATPWYVITMSWPNVPGAKLPP